MDTISFVMMKQNTLIFEAITGFPFLFNQHLVRQATIDFVSKMFFHGENHKCSPYMKFVSKQILIINFLAIHVCGLKIQL